MDQNRLSFGLKVGGNPRRAALFCLVLAGAVGCGGFLNPAFVNLLDPEGVSALTTLPNAPGHVVVKFFNNAVVDERLLSFMESANGGNLTFTNAQRQDLRPRMRLRVRITFTDGSFQTLEFIDGSSELVDPSFDALALPDLNQNDFTTAVVRCDVASVNLEPNSSIEVFIPTELNVYNLVTQTTGTVTSSLFVLNATLPPRFQLLQVDLVDADGNQTLRQNINIRDVPSPAINPLCGSVIAITADGVLAVPFLDGVDDSPSYDGNDLTTASSVGGRYEFSVTVQ